MPDSALPTNLTNTFWETYVRPQLVTTCLSTSRPTGVEGRKIYEADTQLDLTYTDSQWIGEQAGATDLVTVGGSASENFIINFPTAFIATPLFIIATLRTSGASAYNNWFGKVVSLGTSSFTFKLTDTSGAALTAAVGFTVNYMAKGRM